MNVVLVLAGLVAGDNPYLQPPRNAGPRERRAIREACVERVPASRNLVEGVGEPAVAALNALTPAAAGRLSEFYDAGKLGKLPQPERLLEAIAAGGGDDAALWAMEHEKELSDPDALAGFCADPLEVALGLRPLARVAADWRARRLNRESAAEKRSLAQQDEWKNGVMIGGGMVLLALLAIVWRARQTAIR